MRDKQLKVMVNDFLLWELDALKPALGPSRSEVVRHVLQSWLMEHGEGARAHAEHVQKLMGSQRLKALEKVEHGSTGG